MQLTTDDELLNELKRVAADAGYSPDAFISMGKDLAEWRQHAILGPAPPWPTQVDEAEINADILQNFPEWVADITPVGSKWERLHWPDGTITIRLVTPRKYVLAARHLSVAEVGDSV